MSPCTVFRALAALFLTAAGPAMLPAQTITWEQTPGPEESYIQSIVIKPNGHLFASHYAGVFRSTNGGAQWESARKGLSSQNAPVLAQAPNGALYAAIPNSGVFRSSDEGENWIQLNAPSLETRCVAVSPAGDVFAGTGSYGALRSTDQGSTWTQTDIGATRVSLSGFAFAGGSVFASTWGDAGVYRSTDNGTSWSASGTGLTETQLYTIIADNNGTLFAGTYGAGGFRSTDLGATWQHIDIGYSNSYVYSLAAKSTGELYAGMWQYGFWRSTDGGTTWTKKNSGLYSREVNTIAIHPDGSIYIGTTSGVNKSTDDGDSWSTLNTGLNAPGVGGLAVGPTGEIWLGTQYRLFSGSPDGTQWTLRDSDPDGIFVNSIACPGANELLVGTRSEIRRTTDGCATWSEVRVGTWTHDIWTILILPDVVLAATNDSGVYRSTDRGASWSRSGLDSQDVRALVSTGGSRIFAGTYKAGVYASTDKGITWSEANGGLPAGARQAVALAVDESGAILVAIDSYGVFRTTDDGVNWTAAGNGITYPYGNALAVDGAGNYYFGCGDGVFVSTDHGGHWIQSNEGLSTRYVSSLVKIAGGKIAAGTYAGLYISKSGAAAPRIAHSPATLAFGTVFVGTSSTRSILLSNTGGALLTLSGYTLSGADAALFTIAQPGPASLAPGSGDSVVIRFSPLLAGSFSASLDIATNDPLAPNYRIPLSGSGSPIDPVSVYGRQVDFGKVLIDSVGSITFLISNIGNARLILSNFRIAGPDAAEFSFDPPSATYADPGMSLQIKLYFRPKSTGQKTAQFLFDSNDPRDPNGAVSLSGNAVTSGVAGDRKAPAFLLLRENYPNPFRSATTIEFATIRNTRVQLKILDIFGREVATLLDADLPPGTHRARWNAAGLPPGMYQCLLTGGSVSATRRMLLLK